MPEVMKESTHTLLQRCDSMCMYDPIHPSSIRDMTNAYNTNGRAFWSNCKGDTISKNQVRQGIGAVIISLLFCQKHAL